MLDIRQAGECKQFFAILFVKPDQKTTINNSKP